MQTEIPAALEAPARAALAWINSDRAQAYELTGLVDVEAALAARGNEAYELGLVLCDGEICAREQVRIQPANGEFVVSFADVQEREIPPLLDPPEGLRSRWLDEILGKHEFVLLLFYRGLW